MAAVVVVGKVYREDQQVEVTRSKNGVRFTVVVSQQVDALPEALELYEIMGGVMRKRRDRIDEIVDLIRKT
jgi:hypothetical protein